MLALHFYKKGDVFTLPQVTTYQQGQFTDVKPDQWFTPTVASAYELGLIKGNSATTFNPYGDVTIAEAITMAARIHSIYTTGTENFVQGSTWVSGLPRLCSKSGYYRLYILQQ